MRIEAKRDVSPDRKSHSQKAGSSAYMSHTSICVGLHLLLIFLHLVLLFVYFGRYEHSISFGITPFAVDWSPLIITTLMQVFGTIHLALLVMYTQSLAFRCDLYVHQTLTALHDKSSAWLGLGTACRSLWNQFKLRAASGSVACITAYLFGIWLLHITIPTVLNVVPYNATVPTVYRTTLANSTVNADYASAYDILLVYDQVPTLGLQDNMVYDVIPYVPSAKGTATVNGSVYSVDCAALPFVQQPIQAFQSRDRPGQPNMTWLVLGLDAADPHSYHYSSSIPYNAPVIYTGQVIDLGPDCETAGPYTSGSCWAPIVVLSTLSIVDSSGSEAPIAGGPWLPIDPQVIVPTPSAEPAVMITGIQVVACSVNITNIKVDISVNTRAPAVDLQKPLPRSAWKNWTWPEAPILTDQLRIAQSAPYYSPPSGHSSSFTVITGSANGTKPAPPVRLPGFELEAFQVAPVDKNPIPNAILNLSSTKTVYPTAFDVFLNEDLRILADNRTNVTLEEINHTLERALAATFWYGNQVNYSSSHAIAGRARPESAYTELAKAELNLTSSNAADASHAYGEATIMVIVQRLRLNLSLAPIVVGLVTSLVLLALSILVTHVPASARAAFDPKSVVDNGGLLQYTWLLGNEPHLADIASPDLDKLREAGMFDIHMGDEVKKRMLPNCAPTFGDAIYVGLAYTPDIEVKKPRPLILLDRDRV